MCFFMNFLCVLFEFIVSVYKVLVFIENWVDLDILFYIYFLSICKFVIKEIKIF